MGIVRSVQPASRESVTAQQIIYECFIAFFIILLYHKIILYHKKIELTTFLQTFWQYRGMLRAAELGKSDS